MAKTRVCVGLMVGCLLAWGSAATAAAPSVAQMLSFRPKQAGVAVSTPSAQEQEQCKVELVGNGSGWLLRDPQGRPLRRFYASRGSKRVNVWSYYLDGVEVYREMDTSGKGVDQYRWLNSGGMKWGVDTNGDGKIDSWRLISAEEVSQEVLQAVITRDVNRLQALWITDAEMKALELSSAETNRLHALRDQAAAKFQSAVAKLNLGPQTRWERLESTGPQCIPADQTGMKHDLLKHPRAAILYENAGKHDWLQTGEMIQVGLTWRLVDAPSPGTDGMAPSDSVAGDPALQGLMEELRKLDAIPPKVSDTPGPNADIVRYNLQRAAIVDKIIAKVTRPEDHDQWTRQLADCLSAAAQSSPESDKSAYERLVQLERQVVKAQPGTALAAYITFREMSADYAGKLAKAPPDFAKIQEQWIGRLAKFIQDFPQADDAPDALLQLGTVNEMLGKETEAKKWYQQLVTHFGDKKPFAGKAAGALRRLDLDGKSLELTGTTTDGKPFNMGMLAGKVAIVYYWASWNQQSVGDFARLKLLLTKYGSQGVELVSINLDGAPPEAGGQPVPGIQLAHPGGLDGPMATQYGILLPPTVFLVGKDGKVVSRNVQVPNLEEEIKKLMK